MDTTSEKQHETKNYQTSNNLCYHDIHTAFPHTMLQVQVLECVRRPREINNIFFRFSLKVKINLRLPITAHGCKREMVSSDREEANLKVCFFDGMLNKNVGTDRE